MIRQDGDRNRLVPGRNGVEDRFDDAPVEVFDRFHLQRDIALVPRFVAGFDVQKYEIVRAERFDGSLRFPLVIRIVKPRSAFDIDRFEAGMRRRFL